LTGSREPSPVGEFLGIASDRTNAAHECFPIVVGGSANTGREPWFRHSVSCFRN
jgi:hypothetical protein